MTIANQSRTAGPFTGTGLLVSYPFAFKVFTTSDLLIQQIDASGAVTTWALGANYTVVLNADQSVSPGGTITPLVALPAGYSLSVTSAVALTQPASLTNAGGFFPKTIEDALDRLTILIQQAGVALLGALRIPEIGGASLLPSAAGRANQLLGFDSAGNPVTVAPTSGSSASLAADLVSTTQSTKNAGQVGYNPALTYGNTTIGGARAKVIDARFNFGAVIDNATDNLTVMNAGLATPHAEVFVEEGLDLRVSALPTNSYGPRIGPGRVILPLTSPFPGRQQINSDTEIQQQVFGQEYLYAAQVKLQARGAFTALFSGDSTTAGDSLVNTYSQIHALTLAVLRDKGFDLTTVNGGHSGVTAEQWRTTYLAADLTTNPDLYVIRWGINDPGWNKNGTVGTSNAYEAEIATRRDITDYATTMRAALTTIRASKTVAQMSIILMVPNSTADSPNGRDEKWYEQVRRVLRKCARDFQCAFIDTYAIWRDSRNAATLWMDNAFGDGRAIHPLDIMNNWIASTIGDLIVPSAIAVRHVGSAVVIPAITVLPKAYPVGVSTFRVSTWTINGVAVDGMVITIRGADGVCLQEVVNYSSQQRVSKRVGDTTSNTWQDWTSTPTNINPLALSNSWVASTRGITYDKADGLVHIRGRIASGTTTTGTVIATLPVGFRPVFDEYRAVLCGSTLQTAASILISASTGQIQVNSVSSNALLDVGCTFSIF